MAREDLVTIASRHCELIDLDVEIRELRLYPSNDFLRVQGNDYRVKFCGCTAAVQCNMAGIPCRWALNGYSTDRLRQS